MAGQVGDCRYSGAIGGGTHCDGSCSLLEEYCGDANCDTDTIAPAVASQDHTIRACQDA